MYYTVFPYTYKSGREVWKVQITLNSGKRITKKIADKDILSKKEAKGIGKAFFKKIQRRQLAEKYPGAFDKEYQPTLIKLSKVREKHLQALLANDRAKNTIDNYNNAYDHLIRIVGDKSINEVSADDFRKWRSTLLSELKNTSVNTYHRYTKRIFNFAIEEGWSKRNFWAEHGELSEDPTPVKVIPLEHIQRFFDAVQDPLQYFFFAVMYFTGSRPSEVLDIRYENVHLDAEIPYFQCRNLKARNNRMKTLPIHKSILPLFKKHCEKDAHGKVFEKLHSVNRTNQFFKTIRNRAGLPKKYSQKWLRHGLSTNLQSKGVSQQIVSKILDHSTPKITDKYYTHLDELKVFSKAINKMPNPLTNQHTNVGS